MVSEPKLRLEDEAVSIMNDALQRLHILFYAKSTSSEAIAVNKLFVNIIDSDKEREDLTRLTRYRVSKTEI
jgi:hypothetical protein